MVNLSLPVKANSFAFARSIAAGRGGVKEKANDFAFDGTAAAGGRRAPQEPSAGC
jgi:hypothetical protein